MFTGALRLIDSTPAMPTRISTTMAISTTPTVPVVRVPWLEPGILMKTLDAGAYGVICPMVNTREDAQKLTPKQAAEGLAKAA